MFASINHAGQVVGMTEIREKGKYNNRAYLGCILHLRVGFIVELSENKGNIRKRRFPGLNSTIVGAYFVIL